MPKFSFKELTVAFEQNGPTDRTLIHLQANGT